MSRIERFDKHEECKHFKEAKLVKDDYRADDMSGYGRDWKDEYIHRRWSCGCYYYEEHERCPGCQSHDSYYDCSGCKMWQKQEA